MDDERYLFFKTYATIFLLLGTVFGCIFFAVIAEQTENDVKEYYTKELKAEMAIIKSPAIIKVIDTYSEFKKIDGQTYMYNGSFYKVPDTYIGYKWTPLTNIVGLNGLHGVWELMNP